MDEKKFEEAVKLRGRYGFPEGSSENHKADQVAFCVQRMYLLVAEVKLFVIINLVINIYTYIIICISLHTYNHANGL